jgi:hypothetical protein
LYSAKEDQKFNMETVKQWSIPVFSWVHMSLKVYPSTVIALIPATRRS